jgi:hypothetical protein
VRTTLLDHLNFLWSDVPHAADWFTGVALVHTAAAFAIAVFIVVHVYLLTTGHSLREHLMPMISGFDEVDLSPEEEAYLGRQGYPPHLPPPLSYSGHRANQ